MAIPSQLFRDLENRVGAISTDTRISVPFLNGVRSLGNQIQSLESLKKNKPQNRTPEEHAVKVDAAAKKVRHNVTEQLNQMLRTVNQLTDALKTEAVQKAGLQSKGRDSEIRAAILGMDKKDKIDLVHSSIKSGSGEVVNAILSGPQFLSGVDKSIYDRLESDFLSANAPEQMQAIKQLDELNELYLTADKSAIQAAKDFEADTAEYNDSLEKAAEAERDFKLAAG